MILAAFWWLWYALVWLFSFISQLVLLALVLSIPAANYFVWKSKLEANGKLVYVAIFSLLMLGVMTILEIRREESIEDLAHKFDPSLTFYDRQLIKPSAVKTDNAVSDDMGLDTCIDPEGNLVDLKKRLKYDQAWVLLEIPVEFLRRESVNTILQRGGFRSKALETSATEMNRDRQNHIKLEDFRFLDLYLKKERMRFSTNKNDGVLFFDLDGANEETFEKYIRTAEEYQKSLLRETNILFTTSDNYMTNLMKGTFHSQKTLQRTKTSGSFGATSERGKHWTTSPNRSHRSLV